MPVLHKEKPNCQVSRPSASVEFGGSTLVITWPRESSAKGDVQELGNWDWHLYTAAEHHSWLTEASTRPEGAKALVMFLYAQLYNLISSSQLKTLKR